MSRRSTAAKLVGAAEFKARCLELLQDVHQRRATVVITKHGKPIARVTAYEEEIPDTFGALRGTVTYHEDIVAPDLETWDRHA